MSRKPQLALLFAVALLLVLGAVAAPSKGAASASASGTAPAASHEITGTTIGPRTVYWLEATDLAARPEREPGVPNAVTATSLQAAPVMPNAPFYVAALLALSAGLWTVVYRMGRRRA